MELIYMNNDFVEKGIISDFEIDYAYGKDENDFEITTAEKELEQGYYWYIKDTEYGGIIDEIEYQSSMAEGIYRGRTWSGLLNSFSGVQISSNNVPLIKKEGIEDDIYYTISGTPKTILNHILNDDLGLNIEITDESDDVSEINSRVEAVQPIYNMLLELFEPYNLKIVFEYDKGLKVGVMPSNDFTQGQYFDTSQHNLIAKSSIDIPNHLIGVYNNGERTIVKHIYFDENRVMQPYYKVDTSLHLDQPLTDLEYLRAEGTKQVTGLNEKVEVIEGGSGIERYELVTELQGVDSSHPYGTSGNTEYERGVPLDWNDRCYDKYYYIERDYDSEPVKEEYKNFKIKYEYEPVNTSQISGAVWEKTYQNYYKRSAEPDESGEYKYTQLTTDDCYKAPRYSLLTSKPKNWETIYSTFAYYREYYDGDYHYTNVGSKSVANPILQTGKKAPTGQYAWKDHKGEYYRYWRKHKWKVEYQIYTNGKWKTTGTNTPPVNLNSPNVEKTKNGSIFYAINNLAKITFKQSVWKYVKENGIKKKKLVTTSTNLRKELGTQNLTKSKTVKVSETSRFLVHKKTTDNSKGGLQFTSVKDWCDAIGKKLSSVEYKANTYYRMDSKDVAPDFYKDANSYGDKSGFYWNSGETNPPPQITYYKQVDNIKPSFEPLNTYIKVTDNYTNLCEKMLNEYEKICKQALSIKPSLDTDLIDLDIGDIVGGKHPITNEQINNKIVKKIVKGNSFKLDVDYEIG